MSMKPVQISTLIDHLNQIYLTALFDNGEIWVRNMGKGKEWRRIHLPDEGRKTSHQTGKSDEGSTNS